MDLWRGIVDRVNAMGQHPRTRYDIRKRWNDLRGKDTMGQILDNVQENRRLQEGQYKGIREDLQAINNTLISIAGVLADMGNIMREAISHQLAPSTSAAAIGQEAPPEDSQSTSTPPPAEGEPPHKSSLRSRQKPETLAKTPPEN
ncbi:hypothetical protein NDU88_005020 [Pleurodeles waltl]|uniref:Myb/SANT-like DNA-binding domain-containing protein n=1 Tax=Pleurodeles waltl TaxID=8319 RepID=A0AAV7RJS4_PLEWA|nr:hypothetical protein NDU88_005020 [Pleurodeles waltl]